MNRRHFKIKGFDVDVVIESETPEQLIGAIKHLESKGMKLEPSTEAQEWADQNAKMAIASGWAENLSSEP